MFVALVIEYVNYNGVKIPNIKVFESDEFEKLDRFTKDYVKGKRGAISIILKPLKTYRGD